MRHRSTTPVAFAAVLVLATVSAAASVEQRSAAVFAYRVDAHGRLTGLVLSDGTELISANAEKMMTNIHLGDRVYVEPGPGDTLQVVNPVQQVAVTVGPRQTVDLGQGPGSAIGGGPPAEGATGVNAEPRLDDVTHMPMLVVDGRVTLIMHTPVGVPTGFILDEGSQVRLIPRVAGVITNAIKVGDQLHVVGPGTTGPTGRGMWGVTISRPNRWVVVDLMRNVIGAPELGIGASHPGSGD
jgi:hypothetical protein